MLTKLATAILLVSCFAASAAHATQVCLNVFQHQNYHDVTQLSPSLQHVELPLLMDNGEPGNQNILATVDKRYDRFEDKKAILLQFTDNESFRSRMYEIPVEEGGKPLPLGFKKTYVQDFGQNDRVSVAVIGKVLNMGVMHDIQQYHGLSFLHVDQIDLAALEVGAPVTWVRSLYYIKVENGPWKQTMIREFGQTPIAAKRPSANFIRNATK